MPASLATLLNQHQRRHFEVALAMLENALDDMEALVDASRDRDRALTVYDADLPAGATAAVGLHVRAVRTRLRALAAELGFTPQHRSRLQHLRALVIAEMVRLEDSTADKLGGYGAVHPDVATRLDPVLQTMHAELAALLARLRPTEASPTPAAGAPIANPDREGSA